MHLRTTVVTPKAASPRGAGLAIFGKVVGSARAGFAAEAIRISYSFAEELPRSKCGPSGEAESRMSGERLEGKARRTWEEGERTFVRTNWVNWLRRCVVGEVSGGGRMRPPLREPCYFFSDA